MIIEDLKNIIEKNLENKTNEVKRVFSWSWKLL